MIGRVSRHPLSLLFWSIGACVVYSLFPSTDEAVAVALLVWGVGVIGWMIAAYFGDIKGAS